MSEPANTDDGHRRLGSRLFSFLEEMDKEASEPYCKRKAAGLAAYAGHRGGDPANSPERAWNDELRRRLIEAGCPTVCEEPYPNGSRKRCDLVMQLPDGPLWLEVKAAWKAWVDAEGCVVAKNGFFLPYLMGYGKSQSAAHDIKKLESLTPADARYVAGLLVGFDSVRAPMDTDVAALVQAERLVERGWHVIGPHVWPDQSDEACRHACWFWWRRLPE